MNLYAELNSQIEEFQDTRDHIVDSLSLPPTNGGISHGTPPFALDDGSTCYAVITEDEEVSPLPFGYQLAAEDMQVDGVDCVMSIPMSIPGKGLTAARYVPLVDDFELPGERAFCLETAANSAVWKTIGDAVGQIQQLIDKTAGGIFGREWSFTIGNLYGTCEEIESVDQALAIVGSDPAFLAKLLIRSYENALEELGEEISAEEDDDDEE